MVPERFDILSASDAAIFQLLNFNSIQPEKGKLSEIYPEGLSPRLCMFGSLIAGTTDLRADTQRDLQRQ
jgi:hypothetical protein